MARRPYHHGNLRAALISTAEETLREEGDIGQLSLRDLARRAGVSHAAPRRHFRDRQALLDALGAAGLERLANELEAAIAVGPDGFESEMRAAARVYVRFAVEDSALLELMFTTRKANNAPERPYVVLGELVQRGIDAGALRAGDPDRLRLLILATFQGISGLVTTDRLPEDQIDSLIDDATELFIRTGEQKKTASP